MELNSAQTEREMQAPIGESMLGRARRRSLEHEAKLAELRAIRATMEKHRSTTLTAVIAFEPTSDKDLDVEVRQIDEQISALVEAISQEGKLIESLERKSLLDSFDLLSQELVVISTEIGLTASKMVALMRSGEEKAGQIHEMLAGTLPEDSALRRTLADRPRSFISIDGAQRKAHLRALDEAAGLGEFVRNRMNTIRNIVEAELRKRTLTDSGCQ